MKKTFHYICDRCRRTIGLMLLVDVINSIKHFVSKSKQTKMHFCDERCKITFLKGKKYYARKIMLEALNKTRSIDG